MASSFSLHFKRLTTKLRALLYPYKERAVNSARSWLCRSQTESLNELLKSRQISASNNYQKLPAEIKRFSISMVLYNNHDDLRNFLQSLIKGLPKDIAVSLFVRDNDSDKKSWEISQSLIREYSRYFANTDIEHGENIGFGRGHNRNFAKITDALVLVTNLDIEIDALSLRNALLTVSKSWNSDIGSWEFRQLPYEHPKHYDPVTLETSWSSHACVFIRRSAFERINGYDKRLFLYGEDVAFSFALRASGYRCIYMPNCWVVHDSYRDGGFDKPIMYEGVRKANLYLRIKYGLRRDNVVSLFLIALAFKSASSQERRKLVNITRWLLTNVSFYRALIKPSTTKPMPFNEFDYDLMREGKELNHRNRNTECNDVITVIIRTYAGREALLNYALASVKNQTIGFQNIEVIISDDGGYAEIDDDVTAGFPSIKILRCEKRGRVNAGNIALQAARGRFIMFLDDDDLLYADHLETLYNAITCDDQYLAVYGLAWEVPSVFGSINGKRVIQEEGAYKLLPHFKAGYSRDALLVHNLMPIQSVLFARSLYEEHGGFDETLELLEDWHLWCKYSLSTDFKFVKKTTSLYRVPMHKGTFDKRNQALETAEIKMKNLLSVYETQYQEKSRI